MPHPLYRSRRLRESPLIRRMVRETRLNVENLILPLFAVHGRGVRDAVTSMPGVSRLSLDELLKEAKDAASMGIPAILLFGVPQSKDPRGSEAYAEDGIVQQAARAVKETIPDLLVITDVCLCQYTSHGHCGLVEDGRVKNDASVELLARVALSHMESGADVVAPSDMMDGRVGAIRETLDEAGYTETPIMAYSAKYASAFYGPFREAAEPAPVTDENEQPGNIPGYRKSSEISLSPTAPRAPSRAGGVAVPAGARHAGEGGYQFKFTGYASASLRLSGGARDNATVDQQAMTLHEAPRTPDFYGAFGGTNATPGSWVSAVSVWNRPTGRPSSVPTSAAFAPSSSAGRASSRPATLASRSPSGANSRDSNENRPSPKR